MKLIKVLDSLEKRIQAERENREAEREIVLNKIDQIETDLKELNLKIEKAAEDCDESGYVQHKARHDELAASLEMYQNKLSALSSQTALVPDDELEATRDEIIQLYDEMEQALMNRIADFVDKAVMESDDLLELRERANDLLHQARNTHRALVQGDLLSCEPARWAREAIRNHTYLRSVNIKVSNFSDRAVRDARKRIEALRDPDQQLTDSDLENLMNNRIKRFQRLNQENDSYRVSYLTGVRKF